ncbi:hypothetical protein Pint_13051 [Pistacia integerrima]|uniref:Uncharacterized protein n=1 Tax=Pistacia integerrima TaxID=434235 RepID=A0ACC0Y872_9ROSI|nr:hypothetical protein Pint_13051 [Pistacia integerrima]
MHQPGIEPGSVPWQGALCFKGRSQCFRALITSRMSQIWGACECMIFDVRPSRRPKSKIQYKYKNVHQPGIEPGSVPWQGTILPLDHWCC